MDEQTLTELAARAAGEPLPGGGPSSSQEQAELEHLQKLCGLLKDATVEPSDTRRASMLRRAHSAPPMRRWVAAAAAVAVTTMVAGMALMSLGRPASTPPSTLARVEKPAANDTPANKPELPPPGKEPWTGDPDPKGYGGTHGDPEPNVELRSLAKELDKVMSRKPSVTDPVKVRELDPVRVSGSSGGGGGSDDSSSAPPPGMRMGSSTKSGGVAPVAKLTAIDAWEPSKLPKGFALARASVWRGADTGLGFDALWVEYQSDRGSLVLVQAAVSEKSREILAARATGGALLVEKKSTLVLVQATGFEPDALRKLADSLKPVTR